MAVGDDASLTVLYYRIQGTAVSYVASTPCTGGSTGTALHHRQQRAGRVHQRLSNVAGLPTRPFVALSNRHVVVDMTARSTRVPSGGDGNTFVSGLNTDPTAYRAVTFSASAIILRQDVHGPDPVRPAQSADERPRRPRRRWP